ncbi:ABC transporter permease [Atlantibacter hermannii]|uniref:ABC transporter permease n=1 Tax=Atlantibacter hermannii TaxID=565 RepID=UPI002072C2D1|nr:ABC transporter permease [Atlantibacter hermannii]
MTTREKVIGLAGVGRRFLSGEETVTVLRDISLDVYAGEMVAIVGASGSGKSTLMNIIGCLDKPSQGQVTICGVQTQQASDAQLSELRCHHLGFIFQRYHLMPYLTASENVAIPACYTAMPAAERNARAAQLLESLGLAHRLDYRPVQLSGGQQQRVSIARALMNGANIILADEPTGALDRASGQALMAILHTLHQAGHTIVLVTHDREIAAEAERIIEISDGQIVADRKNTAFAAPREARRQVELIRYSRPSAWRRLRDAMEMAWSALLGHRLRAFLSMLGIIIGIAAVVSSMAVGEGAKKSIMDEIGKLGNTTLDVRPGLDWGMLSPEYINALSMADVGLLQQQHWIKNVSPVFSKGVTAVRGSKVAAMVVYGVNEQFFTVQGVDLALGNRFTLRDVEEREQVVVIDDRTRNTLFAAGEDPFGSIILLDGVPFRVAGVAANKAGKITGGALSSWMPYTSLMARMSGDVPLEYITLQVNEGVSLAGAQRSVEQTLEKTHGKRDFFTQTNDQMAEAMRKTSDSMSLLITAIAAISLIVGGVGVMNIMLVSVTERIQEIGIRLSIGARPSDIMVQFLIEAVVICVTGGLIGIAGSWLTGEIFSWFTQEFSMVFTLLPLVLAFSFSVLIGLGFGFFPARNAARLHPTEALARE